MTDEARSPADTPPDHEADVEPTLGGELGLAPLGPDDLLPLSDGYGPEDFAALSTGTETDGDSRSGDRRGAGPSQEG
jgi:hypothetical protein